MCVCIHMAEGEKKPQLFLQRLTIHFLVINLHPRISCSFVDYCSETELELLDVFLLFQVVPYANNIYMTSLLKQKAPCPAKLPTYIL